MGATILKKPGWAKIRNGEEWEAYVGECDSKGIPAHVTGVTNETMKDPIHVPEQPEEYPCMVRTDWYISKEMNRWVHEFFYAKDAKYLLGP